MTMNDLWIICKRIWCFIDWHKWEYFHVNNDYVKVCLRCHCTHNFTEEKRQYEKEEKKRIGLAKKIWDAK